MRSDSEIQRITDDRIVAKASNNISSFAVMRAGLSAQMASAVAVDRAAQPVQYDDDGNEVTIWLVGDAVGSEPI